MTKRSTLRQSVIRFLVCLLGVSRLLLIWSWLPLLPLSSLPVAQAHAFVISSQPVDGSLITTPPAVIRIFFNAPVTVLLVLCRFLGLMVTLLRQKMALSPAPMHVNW